MTFAPSLQRHGAAPTGEAPGETVGAVLDAAFAGNRRLRSYVLDDQGRLRKHVAIYLDGDRDGGRVGLDRAVGPRDEIFVFQALSGGWGGVVMSDRLLVGTRKGLFDVRRGGGSWAIATNAFLGEPVSMLLDDPRAGTLHAALNLGHFGVKLHRSRDGGRSWQEFPAPAFPKVESDEAAPSVVLIWALETGGADRPNALWAGTIPGGLFRSPDGGENWSLVESLWNRPERKGWVGGGYDQPGIHSILVDPRDSRRIVVAVSTGGVWSSADDGASWRLDGRGLIAEYMPPDRRDDPNVQDVHQIVRCPVAPDAMWIQHHNGVFRSRDAGATWTEITAIRPSKFGFAVAVHPRDPDVAWFVPAIKDERRVPVDGALAVARTRDGGTTFETLREGLPQRDAFDLVYRHGLAVDATGERLAMGSTTGHLWVSENAGESWRLVAGNLPPIACVRFAG